MGTIRRLAAWLLAAVLLAVVPVAASAQSPAKLFTLQMGTASLSNVVVATITNATPTGNSTINSALISVESGASWQIVSASASTGQATVSNGVISIIGMAPVKPGKSFTVTIQLAGGSVACGSATVWTATPNTGNSNNGQPFTYAVPPQTVAMRTSTSTCDGQLACGDGFQPTGGNVSGATRLPNNKDGSLCALVNYDFADNVQAANDTIMQWDTQSQPGAGFQYTVTWQPMLFQAPPAPPAGQTNVAWYVNGSLISPVPARACLSGPPVILGLLQSAIPDGVTTAISVSTSAPPVGTPIIIDRERMVIDTGSSGNTWIVKRGQGGTAAVAHSATYADNSTKRVMSNPLPLDGAGNQMQMCLVDEFWTSVDPSLCGGVNAGTACVQKTSTALDLGDGFMKGN